MKIQTQAWLLVSGIVMAPLLILLINVVSRQFFAVENESGLPEYEEISALLNEHMSVNSRELAVRLAADFRRFGETTVFRDDYLAIYSTNPEFTSGVFADREKVMSLLFENKDSSSRYSFFSQNLEENRIYILSKITALPSGPRPRPPPFFIPGIAILIFIIILTLFAVVMSIIIARTITHSVQILENATRRIAEGELDLAVKVKGSNEITSLANSLNKMRTALKEDELRRSRFIMGISHDLKTPLALIKGYAEAIEDGVTGDAASQTDAAEIIIAKADQLEGMINDLIGFVRMDTGEWRTRLNQINLKPFLQNLIKTISTDVELLNHELIHAVTVPENLSVPMDERLVIRAVENLINNAVRYSYEKSEIRFTAVLIGDSVNLTVSNSGPGINEDDLPHVFELLYRGSASRREQGMGLGLAVVKWVIDYHGWSITASSEKERETCFSIIIPVSEI